MSLDKLKALVGEEIYDKYLAQALEGKDYFFAEGKEFIPISKFNDVNNAKKELEAQLKQRDDQLTALQKSAKGNDELVQQIEALKETNEKTKTDYEAQLLQLQKNYAIDTVLNGAGAKNKDALKGMLGDLNAYEFKDGKHVGLEEKVAQIRKDNGWLFETQAPQSVGAKHEPTQATPQDNDLRKAFGLK